MNAMDPCLPTAPKRAFIPCRATTSWNSVAVKQAPSSVTKWARERPGWNRLARATASHVVAERLEDGEITAEEAASVNFVVSVAA